MTTTTTTKLPRGRKKKGKDRIKVVLAFVATEAHHELYGYAQLQNIAENAIKEFLKSKEN